MNIHNLSYGDRYFNNEMLERSGAVVKCLTRDREAAGMSLNDVTALWSLSKTHLAKLCTGSTKEEPYPLY